MTTVNAWNPMVLFESKNGKSLLDKENLQKVYEIEKKIKDIDDWKNVCLATSTSDTSCGPESYFSPLMFL